MRDPRAAWIHSGQHRYQVIGDVLCYEPHGSFSMQEATVLLDKCLQICQQHGFVYTILDAKEADAGDAKVRKLFAEAQKRRDTQGIVYIIGANLVIRSFALLWQNMVRLMNLPRSTIRFINTEAEAWQEIAKDRAERRVAAKSAP
jgi:hypothetical protein